MRSSASLDFQTSDVSNRLFTALALFSRIFIPSLNARIESRENWTPVQNVASHVGFRYRLERIADGMTEVCAVTWSM